MRSCSRPWPAGGSATVGSRRCSRATAAGALVYLLVEPPDFTLVHSRAAPFDAWVSLAYWPALACALGALWRPALAFVPAFYVMASRDVVVEISGYPLSLLDIRYMMEMAQFLALSAVAVAGLQAMPAGRKGSWRPDGTALAICCAFVAIGLHLGNYFWSGVAKLVIGPAPWTWALENQTQNMLLVGLMRGVLPTGHWPGVTEALHAGLGAGVVVSNIAVLAVQLAAPVAVLRMAWLRLASLAYDALHIGIWIAGGLFFWPWVWNNISVLLAARRRFEHEIGLVPRLCCIATIGLGPGPDLGHSARLAWFDVTEIRIPMIEARAGEDAPWVAVPVSYFLSHSYAISHGYHDRARTPGHYPPSIWGSVKSVDRLRRNGRCLPPATPDRPETTEERAARMERFQRFIKAHHAKMADRAGWLPDHAYYLRSHHHPSNPLLHRPFNALAIPQITEYRLLTESVCLSLEGGRLRRTILKQDETVVHVGE